MTAPDPVRAGKALGGAAAAILFLEGIAVLFVPRAFAPTDDGLSGLGLWSVLVLAVVLVLASGLQRRPQGLLIGSALQVPLVLTGLLGAAMWFVGGVFLLIWLYLLQIRKELLGTALGPPPAAPPAG
ncbi:DUF4233 domain-containing protein [Modestobacter roseus]|uniref:Uncharacterized protein DUF4233 n=1 Tax=Modestobacter roseus TaxID=1181884 RepID=A0A562IM83_9ACTN|nr:DUF4233 domain-containing protein [Modestobacter roseus]MQA34100.1 DUF4233 domain-containing protein [Modestobacter roseus]TWH72099.1 uncharacterized protein DUF4233 [Modestobacter roseus]